jgi:hypothetical protein
MRVLGLTQNHKFEDLAFVLFFQSKTIFDFQQKQQQLDVHFQQKTANWTFLKMHSGDAHEGLGNFRYYYGGQNEVPIPY